MLSGLFSAAYQIGDQNCDVGSLCTIGLYGNGGQQPMQRDTYLGFCQYNKDEEMQPY